MPGPPGSGGRRRIGSAGRLGRARERARSTADAITKISLALAEDPELLSLADLLIRMPQPARRGLTELLQSLLTPGRRP
jgi:hypothetical protein